MHQTFLETGTDLKEKVLLLRSQCFSVRIDSYLIREANNLFDKVASISGVIIHLKIWTLTFRRIHLGMLFEM